jgi:hypothetical protein
MGSLGKVKVDDVVRIPVAVKKFYDLVEGDIFDFQPSETHQDLIFVKIIRKGKRKKK